MKIRLFFIMSVILIFLLQTIPSFAEDSCTPTIFRQKCSSDYTKLLDCVNGQLKETDCSPYRCEEDFSPSYLGLSSKASCLTSCDDNTDCANPNKYFCSNGVCTPLYYEDDKGNKNSIENYLTTLNKDDCKEGDTKCVGNYLFECKDMYNWWPFGKNQYVYQETCKSRCKDGICLEEKKPSLSSSTTTSTTKTTEKEEKIKADQEQKKKEQSTKPKPKKTSEDTACPHDGLQKEACVCGEKTIAAGEFCCKGKIGKEACKAVLPRCTPNKDIEKNSPYGCLCDGDIKTSGVCCRYGDREGKHYEMNLASCENHLPQCSRECTDLATTDCFCPSYCEKDQAKEGETCGAYQQENVCAGSKSCYSSKCPEGLQEYSDGNNACGKNQKCCFKDDKDNKKSQLNTCYVPCRDDDGCVCPPHCKDAQGNPVREVKDGFNCQKELGFSNPCSGPLRETRDYQCPQGCFWFNDYDCGPDKNLGNVLWDYLAKEEWRQWYEEKWIKKVEEIGAYFNPDNWAQSFCNPTSKNYKTNYGETIQNAVYAQNRAVGWIAANKQPQGANATLYTVSWYMAGLPEARTLRIGFFNKRVKQPYYYPNATAFINLTAGGSKQETFAFSGPYAFDQVCLMLNETVCFDQAQNKRCYQNLCRTILPLS